MSILFKERPNPIFQLGILFALVGICLLFCLLIVKLSLPLLFSVNDPDSFMTSLEHQQRRTDASLFMQSLASTWGMFLLPAFIFAKFMHYKPEVYFRINTFPKMIHLLIAAVIIIAAGIFSNLIIDITKLIPLPEFMETMRGSQKATEQLIESFFSQNTLPRFLILIIVLAVLPAIGEELFFRGAVQKLLSQSGLSAMSAIVISGLCFSAMHMEIDKFPAIWFMGILLGILYYTTGNLWVSIAAHFLNNAGMISLKFAYMNNQIGSDMSTSTDVPLYITLTAGAVTFLLVAYLWKSNQKSPNFKIYINE